ncbi:hypothetical protein [Thiomicrorhabdus sp. Kp2]|uniref:lipase family protein n=1 Tax=Thiomicrorhabdus sp. Kp2 TaxID=1123518 RepID=UPI00042716A3|nr:hypothetical protein [Thiomicrorhabdus sp. Kp2]
MSVSSYDYSLLAVDVYNDKPDRGASSDLDGWKAVEFSPQNNYEVDGLKIQVYQKGDDYVIAYAGTEDFYDDVIGADAYGLVGGGFDGQFEAGMAATAEALAFIQGDNDRANITVTGHSLGGAHAQVSKDVFGLNGVTLDSPGTSNLLANSDYQAYKNQIQADYSDTLSPVKIIGVRVKLNK